MQSAPEWRRRATALEQAGKYAEAADAYRKEAAIYRKNGDLNGAKVEEMKADRITSGARLYAHLPGVAPTIPSPLAKWEPPYGCYIGAFIDRDERLSSRFQDENFQTHEDPAAFAQRTDKRHASVFCYLSYGRPFPRRWVERLKAEGVAPHIAWEPNDGLQVVQDNDYLRSFATACSEAGCPIFLRYASEMNGDWTRYGGDANAAEYVKKWQLIHRVFSQLAPNVALVWCVNVIPEKNITKFYPGDAFVDWVGINFYSVPFYDNDPKRPGLADNPADYLKYVYATYASKKPIAICEFGASHQAKVDSQDRSAFAGKKINELYTALPRLYPRVKLVDIFDMDNLKHAEPGRQLNNYSVTDSEPVLASYKRAIASPYYLERIGATAKLPTIVPIPATGLTVPAGPLQLSAFARCYSNNFSVTYLVDGKEAATVTEHGARDATLTLAPGPRKLTALVKDEAGKLAAKTEVTVTARS